MRYVISILAVVCLLSCEEEVIVNDAVLEENPDKSLYDLITTTIEFENDDIKVQFREILDYRCPDIEGLNCPWAGNAEVGLTVTSDTDIATVYLNSNDKFPTDTLIFGYNIQLIEVAPYPDETEVTIDDYEITLLIEED